MSENLSTKSVGCSVPRQVTISSSKFIISRLGFLSLAVGWDRVEIAYSGLTLDHGWLLQMLNLTESALGFFNASEWMNALRALSSESYLTHRLEAVRCPRTMLHAAFLTVCNYGRAYIPHPHGCLIPGRSIDDVFLLANAFGIEIEKSEAGLTFVRARTVAPRNRKIVISIPSNLLVEIALILALADGSEFEIFAPYIGPEDAWFFRQAGIRYRRDCSSLMWVINTNARRQNFDRIEVPYDAYEANFWVLLALACHTPMTIESAISSFTPDSFPFESWAAVSRTSGGRLEIEGQHRLNGFDINLDGGGSFLADDGPGLCGFATTLPERSSISDSRWPSRLRHVGQLHQLGFHVLGEYGRTLILPPHSPRDGTVDALDIRTICAVVIAALSAGVSVKVNNAQEVERGISGFWNKLSG